MIYHNHADYDKAIACGVRLAAQFAVGRVAGARVWYDARNDDIGACSREHVNFDNADLETVAFVQRWDKSTIQVRESGAQSTFVKV